MINRVQIQIHGKNPSSLLMEFIRRKIPIYSLDKKKNEIRLIIDYRDYKKIEEIPTSYEIKIIKRYGVCRYLYLFHQYFYFILFSLVGFGCDFFLSHLIFQIDVIHPNQELVFTIQKDLKELGFQKYHFKMDYATRERVKEKLLEKEKDILEWVEIEEEGTRYLVTLQERKKTVEDNLCSPRNIISKKNAIILEIHASSGEIVKKKNDYVLKGDTIVSGFIHNKDEVVSLKCAQGQVFGETWYRIQVSFDTSMTEKTLLEDRERHFSFQFFQWSFIPKTKFREFQKNEYNIIEGKILPVKLGFVEYQKIKVRNYSEKEYENMALEEAYQTMIGKLKDGEEVLSKKVLKKEVKDSKIEIEVFLKVKEDITDYFDISNIDLDDLEEE